MTNVIQNPRQVLLGFIAISLGICIYITFRPSWQTVWIPEIISLDWRKFQLFTEIGNNLTSFLHVFGFSLLTAGIIVRKKWTYMIICGSWLFLNLLFEFLQADAAYTRLNYMSINHDKLNPVLQWLKNYSLHGVFDPKDVFALIIGAILAYIILIKTNKGG
jgi:hypothetical protein